jgi:hypothetical protein
MVDATASMFCAHEWSSRHEPHRWYLECLKCGSTTSGIEVGRKPSATVEMHPASRRPSLAILKPTSSRAA